jgi:predicted MFS family arabinose efflux permease
LPLLVKGSLRGGSDAYAYLMAANGLGALAGALGVAYLARVAHRPTLIRLGLLVFSAAAIGIALSRSLWVTACLMPVAGGAFLTMQSAVNTGLQIATPPHVRGRVMALFVLAFLGVMPLGSLAFGALGHAVGVPAAIAAGEAVCLAWGLVLLARPRLLAAVE